MAFRVVSTKKNEIHVRNDDDEDVISFEIKRGQVPSAILRSEPSDRRLRIDNAKRVAETEAKRLGWI